MLSKRAVKTHGIWARVNDVNPNGTQCSEHLFPIGLGHREERIQDLILELTPIMQRAVLQEEVPVDLIFADDLGVDRHTTSDKWQRSVISERSGLRQTFL